VWFVVLVRGSCLFVRIVGLFVNVHLVVAEGGACEHGRGRGLARRVPREQLQQRCNLFLSGFKVCEFHLESLLIYKVSSRKFTAPNDLYQRY